MRGARHHARVLAENHRLTSRFTRNDGRHGGWPPKCTSCSCLATCVGRFGRWRLRRALHSMTTVMLGVACKSLEAGLAAASMWPRRRSRGRRRRRLPVGVQAYSPASMWPRRRSRGRPRQPVTIAQGVRHLASMWPRRRSRGRPASDSPQAHRVRRWSTASMWPRRRSRGRQPVRNAIARAARCLGLASAADPQATDLAAPPQLINDVK